MNSDKLYKKYIYWIDKSEVGHVKKRLRKHGKKISTVLKSPCEVLNAKDDKLLLASPSVFNRVCKRQGSWYRQSDKKGKYLLVSDSSLPTEFDAYLESTLSESGFKPDSLPGTEELNELINENAYRLTRPDDWERPGLYDSMLFKTVFSLTRFWGRGDNLPRFWLNQRANHANFLAKTYTTEIEGEAVPYTVSENSGVCSSCVEFFNIIGKEERKLVRACPGSITFADVERDKYYDVQPVKVKFTL